MEEEKAAKATARQDAEEALHEQKASMSAAMFQNAKITSCSKIL
jgi:hypothetical protein